MDSKYKKYKFVKGAAKRKRMKKKELKKKIVMKVRKNERNKKQHGSKNMPKKSET